MDNQKFGKFIASMRKEKGWTQLELAQKLNVTDKAVSKWERGMGFPDIKTIEPLAEVLEVSIVELVRSEKLEEEQLSCDNASEAVANVIDVVEYQRKAERKNIITAFISIAALVLFIFVIDGMGWSVFLLLYLPIISLIAGICLLVISWRRWRQKLTFVTTLISGIVALLYPILFMVWFCYSFWTYWSGPN